MNRITIGVIGFLGFFVMPAWADDLLFRDQEYLFRFLYPSSWAQVTTRGQNVRASITNDGGRGFANCVVVVRSIPGLKDVSRSDIETEITGMFSKEFMDSIIGDHFDADILWAGEDKLDNRPAGFAVANLTYQTAGMRINTKNIIVVTFTRLGMYQINCGSIIDQFDSVHSAFMRIISSFVFEDYAQ